MPDRPRKRPKRRLVPSRSAPRPEARAKPSGETSPEGALQKDRGVKRDAERRGGERRPGERRSDGPRGAQRRAPGRGKPPRRKGPRPPADPVAETLAPQPIPVLQKRDRKLFVLTETPSDPAHGTPPQKRSVEALLDKGVIILDKPRGPTSHQVAAWLRDLLGVARTGHGGTLDPKVSGVLPVTLGSATRSADALLTVGKEYMAVVRLHADVPEAEVRAAARRFIGRVRQVPPVRSAVARRERLRRIYDLEVLDIVGRDVLIRVACEAGTYIRNLAVDLGRVLGPGAHLAELRRTRTGLFDEGQLVTLHDVKDALDEYKETGDEAPLRRVVLPFERVLAHLPLIRLRDSAVDAVCHGAELAAPGVAAVEEGVEAGDEVLLATGKGEAVALAKAAAPSAQIRDRRTGVVARAERVFMAPGTYPSSWRKGKVETRRVE